MELGKAKLLRTGLNALYQAIHPVHGIAWTDGKQVILTSLHLHNGEPKFGDSSVVGQFEHVHGLYWGPCPPDAPALLAVQHKKHITIWQLCFNVTERNKLLVSQICDISEPFPVLPQGCVWHPKKEILAVLTTRDASVLHSVHLNNSRIKADIKGSGLIHCACWTKEGNRLVVGVGSALHSYLWDDAQKTLNACSFCPIFDVGGYICAVEATLNFQVAVATELPLDKICGLNAGVAFEVPASIETESFPSQSSLCDVHPLSRGLVIPDRAAIQSPTSRRKLIEEIKSPLYEQSLSLNMSDLKDKKISMNFPPAVESLDAEPVNRTAALSATSLAFSNKPTSPKRQAEAASKIPNSYRNSLFSEKEASYFLKNVEKLSGNFTELQHHLCELTELLKSGKRNPPVYPSSQEPSFINITCQKQLSRSDSDERRAVILCGGKLRLNIVQQIFNLSLVEMQHGSSWIVLTVDSEGFVPLMFTSTQEIVVRDASTKGYSARSSKTLDIISSTEGCRPTSSESLDITSSLEGLRDCSPKALDSSSPSEQPSSKM
ncbi:WD repeat and coiled-coil-containing protein isoform X4 [Mycteria americana]|uniref:WD repeat and coiled-coil-containing protein isoform X4 n=1 Tax=Mycteria americana TaxID=33587 RepID=UPI003F5816BC